MKIKNLKKFAPALGAGLVAMFPILAVAGTGGGSEFTEAKNKATDWLEGDLGITIATAGGIWGMIAAVGGNIKMAALGLGIAAVAALSSTGISAVFGAVI